MSNYLIELSVIHLVLMLAYWFLLRNERQYFKMRLYLITATLLALIIPLFRLPKLFFSTSDTAETIPVGVISLDPITISPVTNTPFWENKLFIWTYVAISSLFLIKFLGSIVYLVYLERKSTYEKFHDLYIRKVRNIEGSFTFLNWIFLSEKLDKSQPNYDAILKHEQAHVSLGHTYDLIFLELFKVAFWWLPTAWLIPKEIKKIHEYQADAHALKSYSIDHYSSILISSVLKFNGLSLASSFHDGLILKRIKAMKQQAKNVNPWKLVTLGILSMILFVVFACSEEPASKIDDTANERTNSQPDKGEVFTAVEELPQYPGGIDAFYRYVANNIQYPKEARTAEIEGKVYVSFIVEKDGSLSSVSVADGIGAGCDAEAIRVVRSAKAFEPGRQRGKEVRVRMVLPFTFKLNKEKVNPDNSTQGVIIVDEVRYTENNLKINANYDNGIWSGTIYDENGDGLPGANIVVEGSTRGTVSDLDGQFSLKADKSKDINVSFVGYQTVRLLGSKP